MTVYAYLRVSKDDSTTDNQKKIISDAAFAVDEWVCEEGISGSMKAFDRPAFSKMTGKLKAGDTIICTVVDRLGRSASDVLATVEELKRKNIKVRLMQFDGVDLASPTGKMMLTMLAACAEFERNMIIERTVAGLARAKGEGKVLGASLKTSPDVLAEAMADRKNGMILADVAKKHDIPLSSADRLIKKWDGKMDEYEDLWNRQQEQVKE